MNGVLETVVFWFAFALITGWVLRRFYFSKDANLPRRLRLAAGVGHIAVFVLLFFPWLPGAHGGSSGWGVVLQGNVAMTVLALLLSFSFLTLFVSKKPMLSKAGVVTHVAATLFLFGFMIRMFPDTISLTFRDTAPIFAALFLLVNTVVLLLLWHEFDKNSSQK